MVKRCTVILGAGASHGVSLGNYPIDPQWRPPLARELFNIAAHKNYAPILERYPGALSLSAELAHLSKAKAEFKLEEKLHEFANHKDEATKRNFRYIPFYLWDLLSTVCADYTRSPEAYTMLVRQLLAEHPHEVAFLTLNYDTLLERALTLHDGQAYKFDAIGNYVRPERQAMVVKVHGSIGWWVRCGKPGYSWEECITTFDLHSDVDKTPIIPDQLIGIGKHGCFTHEDHWLYPLLTAPLAGKGAHSVVCPQHHVERLKDFVKDCRKFLVIGTSGLDEDVFELLNHTQHCSDVWFVGPGAPDTAARFREKVEAFQRAAKPVIQPSKFSGFVTSDGLPKFAQL